MLETLRWIFAASLATCLVSIAIRRRRIVPAFTLYLLAAGIQTGLHWSAMDKWSDWWVHWSVLVTMLRCLAAIEVFWTRCPISTGKRIAWAVALAGLCASIVIATARISPADWWMQAAQRFLYVEAGTAAFILLSIGVTRIEWGNPPRFERRHSWLLFSLVASHLAVLIAYERGIGSDFLLGISYAAASACFCGWTVTVFRNASPVPPVVHLAVGSLGPSR